MCEAKWSRTTTSCQNNQRVTRTQYNYTYNQPSPFNAACVTITNAFHTWCFVGNDGGVLVLLISFARAACHHVRLSVCCVRCARVCACVATDEQFSEMLDRRTPLQKLQHLIVIEVVHLAHSHAYLLVWTWGPRGGPMMPYFTDVQPNE